MARVNSSKKRTSAGASFSLGVRARCLLTMEEGRVVPLEDMFVGVKDGDIAAIEPFKASHRRSSRKFIDAGNHVVMPGFVNAHTHLPMTLFRGLEDDSSFHVWLFERILPLEKEMLSPAFTVAGLELAAMECARFGVTTVNDHYYFAPQCAAAWDRIGLRGNFAQVYASFPLPDDGVWGADKAAAFAKLQRKYESHPRIRFVLGPHAPYTCDDGVLRSVAQTAKQLGARVHIHVSESRQEIIDSKKAYGKSPVRRLHDLGLLNERAMCAHMIHLDEEDRVLLKESGASVIYNPDSNFKVGVGVAPIADYLRRGIPVALATDGAASNNDLSMFGPMDLGAKAQKMIEGDSAAMTAEQALSMATWGGARAIGWGDRVGSLSVGMAADFIAVDFNHPHMQPVHSVASQLVYSAQGLEVDLTVCEGRVIYERERYATLKPAAVYDRASKYRDAIQKKLRALRS